MWPAKGIRSEAEDMSEDEEYDEFGFKVDVEDGPEQSSSKLLSTPFKDNPQQRLRWLAHLEFAQTQGIIKYAQFSCIFAQFSPIIFPWR